MFVGRSFGPVLGCFDEAFQVFERVACWSLRHITHHQITHWIEDVKTPLGRRRSQSLQ